MSLGKRISDRNQPVKKATTKILNDYSDVFDEAFKLICNDEMVSKWVAVDFHSNTTRLINLIGIATYRIGSTASYESGEPLYIDENNVMDHAQHLRMVLPIILVDDVDIDGIEIFMKEYSELVHTSSPDEMDLMVADDAFLIECFTCFKEGLSIAKEPTEEPMNELKVKSAPRLEYEGFDLTELELDEIQLQQLRLLRPEGQS